MTILAVFWFIVGASGFIACAMVVPQDATQDARC